jgi:hypothetical protein
MAGVHTTAGINIGMVAGGLLGSVALEATSCTLHQSVEFLFGMVMLRGAGGEGVVADCASQRIRSRAHAASCTCRRMFTISTGTCVCLWHVLSIVHGHVDGI